MRSQCIFAILMPGKVNTAPNMEHQTAIKNLITIFEAGPLRVNT